MKITFEKLFNSKEELQTIDRTNPYNVAASFANICCSYNPQNDENYIDMLGYLMGEFQPISQIMRQNIKDRMTQNEKYKYIGKSYFKGATPENEYTPNVPYEIEITENDYSKIDETTIKLFLKSGGTDSPRPIIVKLAKDNNYYIFSDSFMGLLADIKTPESKNPWA